MRFLYVPDDSSAPHYLQFRNNSGTLEVSAIFYNDGFAASNQTNAALGSTTQLEVHCKRATTNVSSDGFCKVYADASFGSPIINITGIDNYDIWASHVNPTSFRLGVITNSSGITGSCYFTRMLFRNDGTEIGSYASSAAPTVTDISTQSGTFGTQKTVACTIADTDSDIVRCDVSTDGTTLITLTASGAASVTNNGTTAVYVTGTHTDVVATLGNGIKLDGIRSGAELSHTETITVLATDSLDATGNDTFDIIWSVPTGVGTQTLYLTGTQAQINAMLATVEITPVTDFTGTIQCLMYSVTSTPLTDLDVFPITVADSIRGPSVGLMRLIQRRRRRRS